MESEASSSGGGIESTLTAVARALADDTRMHILAALAASGELSCGELVELCSVGQSTVSHHLKALADAGLVEVRQAGQRSLNRVNTQTLRSAATDLLRIAGPLALSAASGNGWRCRPAHGLPDLGTGVVD